MKLTHILLFLGFGLAQRSATGMPDLDDVDKDVAAYLDPDNSPQDAKFGYAQGEMEDITDTRGLRSYGKWRTIKTYDKDDYCWFVNDS
mmetsp:Transcript_14912/g.28476  ORF Transcript_14912/g.28476 Transcript_14912/m.28476 type:complete len:88 (+) Transcript_14912:67-330(+)